MRSADVTPSGLWRRLLPPGIAAYETRRFDLSPQLYPEERIAVRNAIPKRIEEFAAGRVCARRALAELGFESLPLPRGADRSPVWPAGVAGSITHTDGYCGAAVAWRRQVLGIGIDAEIIGRLNDDMQRLICTPDEYRRLAQMDGSGRQEAAAVVFSAKEAFFKCQSGAGGDLPDFQDVELHLNPGAFVIEPRRKFTVFSAARGLPMGHYEASAGMVFTGIAFLAA